MSSVTSGAPTRRAAPSTARRLEERNGGGSANSSPRWPMRAGSSGSRGSSAAARGPPPARGPAGGRRGRAAQAPRRAGRRPRRAARSPSEPAAAVCGRRPRGRSVRHHHIHEGAACRSLHDASPQLWWELRARSSSEADEFLRAGVRDVTVHEVGHTLGLRHNFRGSYDRTFYQRPDAGPSLRGAAWPHLFCDGLPAREYRS
ncbi:unnamed protein product [Prorocentrum cordatum]|uniref:EcxA zinc-binding domain-containing protein n=1 Tax=Prorocentrum cordatum TaxID=2364126 RepID=A0ABN9VGV3_9DINO|nr:unnamed protein product [Polarella glacialis]